MSVSLAIAATFPSKRALQQAVNENSILHHFEVVPVRSNKSYYTVKCKADGCPWRLYGARVEKSELWQIRTFQNEHTCYGLNKSKNKQANAEYLAHHTSILAKMREQPEYKPIDIVVDVKRELGVTITYSTALRAKETAMRIINGTHEEGYRNLPEYCAKIEQTNPGSTVLVSKTPDSRFERLFLCFGASASGFANCRPLLGLDGSHLKSKYKGATHALL
jgi:uncharacterized iron-regulated membrane protein